MFNVFQIVWHDNMYLSLLGYKTLLYETAEIVHGT